MRKKATKYRSGFEGKVAASLKDLGAPVEYETRKFKYTVPASQHTYTSDFSLSQYKVIECKGRFTSKDRQKLRHVKECNPKLRVLLLFQRDNYINKGSKTKYSDWARKYGFEYHVSSKGEVPEEWLR